MARKRIDSKNKGIDHVWTAKAERGLKNSLKQYSKSTSMLIYWSPESDDLEFFSKESGDFGDELSNIRSKKGVKTLINLKKGKPKRGFEDKIITHFCEDLFSLKGKLFTQELPGALMRKELKESLSEDHLKTVELPIVDIPEDDYAVFDVDFSGSEFIKISLKQGVIGFIPLRTKTSLGKE